MYSSTGGDQNQHEIEELRCVRHAARKRTSVCSHSPMIRARSPQSAG
jgi:hypothetical protein